MDVDKRQIRYQFRELLTRGGKRSLYLARAFLLGIPYSALEKKSNDQPLFYEVVEECCKMLFPNERKGAEGMGMAGSFWIDSNQHINKEKEQLIGGIYGWIRESLDAGETLCGGGWEPSWRKRNQPGGTRVLCLQPNVPKGNEGMDGRVQHDSCPSGKE